VELPYQKLTKRRRRGKGWSTSGTSVRTKIQGVGLWNNRGDGIKKSDWIEGAKQNVRGEGEERGVRDRCPDLGKREKRC